jgi:hypothetical protein
LKLLPRFPTMKSWHTPTGQLAIRPKVWKLSDAVVPSYGSIFNVTLAVKRISLTTQIICWKSSWCPWKDLVFSRTGLLFRNDRWLHSFSIFFVITS